MEENLVNWYHSFSDDEDRIIALNEPKSAADYLDQKRADYILDHTRIRENGESEKTSKQRRNMREIS